MLVPNKILLLFYSNSDKPQSSQKAISLYLKINNAGTLLKYLRKLYSLSTILKQNNHKDVQVFFKLLI